jgi:hypothetical protein
MNEKTKPRVRTSTSARVTVTVEVNVGSWGPECELDQVYRQGSESAIGKLRRVIGNDSSIRILKVGAIEAMTTRAEYQ